MKDIHILAIIVRLFALLLAVTILKDSFEMLLSIEQQDWIGFSYAYVAYPIIIVLVSLFLWFFPVSAAKGILPYRASKEVHCVVNSYELFFSVALSVLALYFMINSLIDLFYWAYLWIMASTSQTQFIIATEQKAGAYATVFEFFIGFFILISAKKIATFFNKF